MPRIFGFYPLVLAFAILLGPTRQAFARRGGWSQDPYWWRIEVLGVTIILVIGRIAFIINTIARRRDEEAHARIEKFPDGMTVDDSLKDL